METIDVHSKSFVVKWIQIPDHSTCVFQVKPIKRSISFEIYRSKASGAGGVAAVCAPGSPVEDAVEQPGAVQGAPGDARAHSQSVSHRGSASALATALATSPATAPATTAHKKKASAALSLEDRLKQSQLTKIASYGLLTGNQLLRSEIKVEKGGIYAFIFDNTFSKSYSKKISFNKFFIKDDLKAGLSSSSSASVNTLSSGQLHPKKGQYLQGYLLKKKRKKLQGFTKRFFILNFKYNILSYHYNENSLKTRGEMQINLSTISAFKNDNLIIIDSGMEIWQLKTLNADDWNNWTNALNFIKLNSSNSPANTISTGNPATSAISPAVEPKIDENAPTRDFSPAQASSSSPLSLVQAKLNKLALYLDSISSTDAHDTNLKNSKLQLSEINTLVDNMIKTPNPLSPNGSIFSQEFFDALEGDSDDFEDIIDDDSSIDNHVLLLENNNNTANNAGTPTASSNLKNNVLLDQSSSKSSLLLTDIPQPTLSVDKDINESTDLYPLPLSKVHRRNDVKKANSQPPSLFSFLRKNVGKDLSTISMPVTSNEPLTILQKISEIFEFSSLIDEAINEPNESIKILKISTFAISNLSSLRVKDRNLRKPFNPILGETFELVREDLGFRLIGEKVNHKPQIFAFNIESKNWEISLTVNPEQKFWGKSIELINKGDIVLTLKPTGQVFKWELPTTYLKNIIAGERYSEPVNSTTVIGSNGLSTIIDFKKPASSGLFSSGKSEDLSIQVFDTNSNSILKDYFIEGKWTSSLVLKSFKNSGFSKKIWEASALLSNYQEKYGFTKFASNLNQISSIEKGAIPITDSRNRPDLRLYEDGDNVKAEEMKLKIEQLQRDRRNELANNNQTYKPVFFKQTKDDKSEYRIIKGEDNYWNKRKLQKWDGIVKLW